MQTFHSYSLEQNQILCHAECSCSRSELSCNLSGWVFTIKFCPQKSENPNGTKLFPQQRFRARMKSLRHVPLFPFQPILMPFLISVTTNRGEVYDGRLFWFLTYLVSACNFSRYISPRCSARMRKPWEISIYESKKGRNKEYLTQLSTQTAENVEMNFSAYDTLCFSLVYVWQVKQGKRLRIWKKNHCLATRNL